MSLESYVDIPWLGVAKIPDAPLLPPMGPGPEIHLDPSEAAILHARLTWAVNSSHQARFIRAVVQTVTLGFLRELEERGRSPRGRLWVTVDDEEIAVDWPVKRDEDEP